VVAISDSWTALAQEGRTEPGWHARRVYSQSPCDVRAAIRPDGTVAVLFEVLSKSIPPGADLPDCLGFQLSIETITPGPGGMARLCLLLKDRRFRDVFTTMAEDVGAAVAASATETAGVRALLARLSTWERFISRFGPDRLSDEELVGLFAELHFLRSEIIPVVDPASGIRAWRGPHREPQDFRFRSVAIEVKASAARSPSVFQVANLDQLDAGSRELLLVYHVIIDPIASAGETLPAMISSIRSSLANVDAGAAIDFDASLIEAGYLDVHAEAYQQSFSVRQVRWFKVTETFPRLTRSSVARGVAEASYSVSIDACLGHLVESADARTNLLERL
jgi:Putative  PD-(D/E)XK family member, (DUF4420)